MGNAKRSCPRWFLSSRYAVESLERRTLFDDGGGEGWLFPDTTSPIEGQPWNVYIAGDNSWVSWGDETMDTGNTTHAYADNGSYTGTAGAYVEGVDVSGDFQANVLNLAPYASTSRSYSESTGLFTVGLNNIVDVAADASSVKYGFSGDYNSLPSTYGAASNNSTATIDFQGASGASSQEIWCRVIDKDGGYRDYPTVLNIADLAVATASASQLNLTWGDSIAGEDGWRIQRSTDGQDFSIFKNLPANTTHYEDIELNEGTRYWYRVRAVGTPGAANDIGYSPKKAGTTKLAGAKDVHAVPDPVSVTGGSGGGGSGGGGSNVPSYTTINLSWTNQSTYASEVALLVSFDGDDFVEYKRFSSTTTSYRFHAPVESEVRFQIKSLSNANESQGISATDPETGLTSATSTTSAMIAPSGMTSSTAWADGVDIQWLATSYADSYAVEWSNDGSEFIELTDSAGGSYFDEHPTLGLQFYRVKGLIFGDQRYESLSSIALPVTPIAPPVGWYDDNGGPNGNETLAKYSTPHNNPVLITPLANDRDYDGTGLTIASVGSGGHGSTTLHSNNTITYTPTPGYVGTDEFTYVINDGTVNGRMAKVAVDVTNEVSKALPIDASYDRGFQLYHEVTFSNQSHQRYVHEGQLGIAAPGDDDPVTYKLDKAPSHGQLTINPQTGAFSYNPGQGFENEVKFTYIVNDGYEDSAPAAVNITQWEAYQSSIGYYAQENAQYLSGIHTYDSDFGYEILSSPSHGHIDVVPFNSNDYYLSYVANPGTPQDDAAIIRYKYYGRWTPPHVYLLGTGTTDIHPGVALYLHADQETTIASSQSPITAAFPGFTWQLTSSGEHGELTQTAGGGLSYTPGPMAGGDYYRGVDSFTFQLTETRTGRQFAMTGSLYIGTDAISWPTVTIEDSGKKLDNPTSVHSFPPTLDGLHQAYEQSKSKFAEIMNGFVQMGQRVSTLGNSDDLQIINSLDAVSEFVDPLSAKYDEYLSMVAGAAKAAGEFLADQWFVSQADADAVMNINKLPIRVGSLTASKEKMKQLADALAAQGEGAGIAVDTANKVVTFAETSHKVLTTVEMAGGVTVLLKTGATLLVKEGIKACAKQAAEELMQTVASALAAELANYAADLAGISAENRQWIKIGVDAFQVFAFLKAAKQKVNWDGACFVAGTNVIVGMNEDGSPITRNIEEIEVGDSVLSRDQFDLTDDVEASLVTQVFRKTSDHLRVLQIEDSSGNVETIRTTDEHPFYVEGKGWTAANELELGATLDQPNGSDAIVIASKHEPHPEQVTVFNFEIAGDHTYFVEDGNGPATAVWVHNYCAGSTFFGRLKGVKPVAFKNAPATSKVFTMRTSQETATIRDAFNGTPAGQWRDGARGEYIKFVASAKKGDLHAAGFSPSQTKYMSETGHMPKEWGFEIHHRTPIEGGGDNGFSNLIVMKKEPYHDALTREFNILSDNTDAGKSIEFAFPLFEGKVVYHGN